jgi:hypothetical protein
MSVTDLGFGAFGCWGRQARLISRILFSLGLSSDLSLSAGTGPAVAVGTEDYSSAGILIDGGVSGLSSLSIPAPEDIGSSFKWSLIYTPNEASQEDRWLWHVKNDDNDYMGLRFTSTTFSFVRKVGLASEVVAEVVLSYISGHTYKIIGEIFAAGNFELTVQEI